MTAIRLRVLPDGTAVVRVADLAGHLKPGVLLDVTSGEDRSSEHVSGDDSPKRHTPPVKVGDKVAVLEWKASDGAVPNGGWRVFRVIDDETILVASTIVDDDDEVELDEDWLTRLGLVVSWEIVETSKPAIPELIVGRKYRVKENPGRVSFGKRCFFKHLLRGGETVRLLSPVTGDGNVRVSGPNDSEGTVLVLPEYLEGPLDEPKLSIEDKIRDAKFIKLGGDYLLKSQGGEFWITANRDYDEDFDYYPDELANWYFPDDDIEVIA